MTIIGQFSLLAWGIMGCLGLMSVFALSIVLLKMMQFFQLGVGSKAVGRSVAQALEHWQQGEEQRARALTQDARALRLQVLDGLLQPDGQSRGLAQARDGIEILSRHLRGLEAVVQAAPMLGLLGTVIGMIEAFGKLAASSGAADPALLAGGIWTALVTTALGLSIAILFYLTSLWLDGRIAREAHDMEQLLGAAARARSATSASSTPAAPRRALAVPEAQSASPFPAPASPSDPGNPNPGYTDPPRMALDSQTGSTGLAKPVPGGWSQRTDPGLPASRSLPANPQAYAPWDDEAGPAPESFRSQP